MYDKLFEEFINEVKKEGTFATSDILREVVNDMLSIIKQHPDDTPEELVERVIEDNVRELEFIRRNYPIPGYTVGVNVGNINVKMFGGNIDCLERKMPDDALFDIASMTKFYTQIIAYNLINEGVFSYNDKIKDLDSRFYNVEDLTIGDVLSFTTEFKTDGRLSEKQSIGEALNCLYGVKVVATKKYNYNDIGMMIIKEVMEGVTQKSYKELLDKYIVEKLDLKNTHLIVPEKKIERLTGSSNASIGKVNDPSALSVGGYSGHAGVFAANDDLIRLGKAVFNSALLSDRAVKDAYTPGLKVNRGIMGNTYTSHEQGIDMSYVDILEPKTNFAIQGSTRTQMNIGKNYISTILFNPASMSMDRALEEEAKINEARALRGQNPLSLVKHFRFNQNGEINEYNLIDARLMAPSAKTVEPVTTSNAKLALRLRFLNKVIEAYDKNYNKEINVDKSM